MTDLNLFGSVIFWLPVRYSSHAHFTIPKLLTERSILRLRVSTSVGVVEGDIKKKWPLLPSYIAFIPFFLSPFLEGSQLMILEELADQQLDAGDVPPHLEDRAVLLCVGKIERVHRSRTHMLLPNYT